MAKTEYKQGDKGIVETIDGRIAYLSIFDPQNNRLGETQFKTAQLVRKKIKPREGAVLALEARENNQGLTVRVLKELPFEHSSPEEIAREEARLREAFA